MNKALFVLSFQDVLVYDNDFLIAAYKWPFGRNASNEAYEAMAALIEAKDASLIPIDVNLFDICLHHKTLWNNPIVGHA